MKPSNSRLKMVGLSESISWVWKTLPSTSLSQLSLGADCLHLQPKTGRIFLRIRNYLNPIEVPKDTGKCSSPSLVCGESIWKVLAPCTDLSISPELALLCGQDIGDPTAARKESSLRKTVEKENSRDHGRDTGRKKTPECRPGAALE